MKVLLFILALKLFVAPLFAERGSVDQKLDLIIEKLGGLENIVSSLEKSNQSVKSEIKQVEKKIQVKNNESTLTVPTDPKKKTSFFSNLRNQLNSEEAKASGPWANKENWSNVRKNLTRYQIRTTLGDPHEVKTSLDPRIGQVYSYTGDLDADGVEEEGVVNFYRDRVVSFKSPF